MKRVGLLCTLSAAVAALLLPSSARAGRIELELNAAVKAGHVKVVDARGAGIKQVDLTLRASVDIEVTIEAGSFFDTRPGASHQRMVVTERKRVKLDEDETKTVEVTTACANFSRAVPNKSDRFFLGLAPEKLRKLVRCLEKKKVSHSQRQGAVWRVTDNVDRKALSRRPQMTSALLGKVCDKGSRKLKLLGKERCERWLKKARKKLNDELMKRAPDLVKDCRISKEKALKKAVKKLRKLKD